MLKLDRKPEHWILIDDIGSRIFRSRRVSSMGARVFIRVLLCRIRVHLVGQWWVNRVQPGPGHDTVASADGTDQYLHSTRSRIVAPEKFQ